MAQSTLMFGCPQRIQPAIHGACEPNTIPGPHTRFTLTIAGLLKLAENELEIVPNLGIEHSQDKRNADSLAKMVVCVCVCVHATWFSVQIVGRLSTGYASSLLEISTFPHDFLFPGCLLLLVAQANAHRYSYAD